MYKTLWGKIRKAGNCGLALILAVVMVMPVGATTISGLQQLITEQQKELDKLNENIGDWEDAQDLLEEEISDLDAELLNTMTVIGLLEDDIVAKQEEIKVAQAEYEVAKETEGQQYEAMKIRIQMMYEAGNISYLESFLAASGFGDMLNRASNIEALYEYDQKLWDAYILQKETVAALKAGLEEDKAALEADKASLDEQKVYLDGLLAKKKAESDNFEAQISKAKQEAAAYKKKIQQEQAQIKKLEEAERKRLEEERRRQEEERRRQEAANGNYVVTKFDTSIIDNASGSELGKKIAKYACQYIGNPYVYGGTSLTNGADCSGFTYRIYYNFGYTLPRTSFQQRSAGKAVEYANAQPGDLICYDGHVGMYLGGGYIVHASSPRSGIKVSKATYREILAVRRILDN